MTLAPHRTPTDFPPASMDFLLPPEVWPRVQALLNADRDITLADIFGPAVESWLDSLHEPDEGHEDEPDHEPTRFTITPEFRGTLAPVAVTLQGKPLTNRQQSILHYLRDRIGRDGQSPTIREIMDRFEYRSPNSVMGHLDALERRGLITRDSLSARGIRLVSEGRAA